ncbi:hypothetical protein BpHYR1_014458 [Brachionus plicatilis]|uniref:Uncharacterized protein n=1 Tax=Brachionus plicatilis TaxID=10195 RepID=A0A3M7PTW4_BRAPC|nr:hypothetical protein BpHYR1_014458 [Brachionus plicatilis]
MSSPSTVCFMKFSSYYVSPTMDRVRAICRASAPTNTKYLHSFLCSVTWSSRFMRNLCTMAEPLWTLTKSGIKWL